jgi:uncharacterized integral membrane protein
MTEESGPAKAPSGRFGGLSNRAVVGIVIAVVVLLFIFSNLHETKVSFLFLSAKTPLWEALTACAVGGFAAGYLVRRRHKD